MQGTSVLAQGPGAVGVGIDRSVDYWHCRPVFPAWPGGWRDPSENQNDLRQAFANAGYDWMASHG